MSQYWHKKQSDDDGNVEFFMQLDSQVRISNLEVPPAPPVNMEGVEIFFHDERTESPGVLTIEELGGPTLEFHAAEPRHRDSWFFRYGRDFTGTDGVRIRYATDPGREMTAIIHQRSETVNFQPFCDGAERTYYSINTVSIPEGKWGVDTLFFRELKQTNLHKASLVPDTFRIRQILFNSIIRPGNPILRRIQQHGVIRVMLESGDDRHLFVAPYRLSRTMIGLDTDIVIERGQHFNVTLHLGPGASSSEDQTPVPLKVILVGEHGTLKS